MIFWRHILERLQRKEKLYLLTVIENFGSSPGRKGFKMLVTQDEFIFGSIGGGVMEFALVEEAQHLLLGENPPNFIKKQIHKGSIENGSGMICSGEQTVAFHCLVHHHMSEVESIVQCLERGDKGTLRLTGESFAFSDKMLEKQFEFSVESMESWYFEEHIGFREILYIIGGGHVGVAVSELFAKLGFYVIVYDNRERLNTLQNNTSAHHTQVVPYAEIAEYLQQGEQSYVVIMTNKYTDDKLALSKLIRNKYKFMGVLGSKAKLKTMWKDLLKEGFTRDELQKVHAPIGLSIKSETPDEIAVSIAAQVIAIKNQDRK